jgi:hypothetical protein
MLTLMIPPGNREMYMNCAAGEDYVDAFNSLALVDVGVGDERRRTGKTRSTVGDGHCCAVHGFSHGLGLTTPVRRRAVMNCLC